MAREFFEALSRPGTSPETLWAVSTLLVLCALGILGWIVADLWRERRAHIAALRRLAADHAAEKGLDAPEAALLERIILAEGAIPGPRGFERNVEVLLKEGVSPDLLGSLRVKCGFHRPRPGLPLYSTREIEVGQDVVLTDPAHVWRAGVVEIDEEALVLKIPAEATAALRPGDSVKVSFWRDFDARYFFQTHVRGVRRSPAPIVFLHHPPRIERFQEREDLRSAVDWKVEAIRLTEEEFRKTLRGPLYQEAIEGARLPVRIADISAGGARLRPVPGIAAGDHLVIPVPSSERKGPLMALARVIAADDSAVRCEFVALTPNERDEIHREILRERRRRKRTA